MHQARIANLIVKITLSTKDKIASQPTIDASDVAKH